MTNLSVTSPIRALNQPVNDIIASLLASKHKATTRNTYRQNLKYFAHYLLHGLSAKGERIIISDTEMKIVMAEFLAFEKLTGVAYLSQYQSDLVEAGYTPNTINIRIAAIRALVKFAFKRGFCHWLIEDLKALEAENYRDTSGIAKDKYAEILSDINTDTISGKRDYAIMRLLWDCALRRG